MVMRRCQKAVVMLTWYFDRIEAFVTFIGSSTWYWENPRQVRKQLKDLMATDSDEDTQKYPETTTLLIL